MAGAYDYLYAISLSAMTRAEARLEAYGDDGGRNSAEVRGFKKICDLITLFEENETEFLDVIDNKRAAVLNARERKKKEEDQKRKHAAR